MRIRPPSIRGPGARFFAVRLSVKSRQPGDMSGLEFGVNASVQPRDNSTVA